MGRFALDQESSQSIARSTRCGNAMGQGALQNGNTEDNDEDRNRRGHADVGPIRSGAIVPYVDSIDARSQWSGVKEISNKGG